MYAIERYGAWLKEIANDEYGLCKELSLEECKDIVKYLIKEAEFQNSPNRNFEKYSVDFFLEILIQDMTCTPSKDTGHG